MSAELLIFDFETLGVQPDTTVLAFAAIACDLVDIREDNVQTLRSKSFFCTFDKASQQNRSTDQSTIDWWKNQSDEAKAVLKMEPRYSLANFILEFDLYCSYSGVDLDTTVLIRGMDFDSPIMKNIYRSYGAELPYNNWAVRDIRSMVDIVFGTSKGYPPGSKDREKKLGLVPHSPVDDCIKDLFNVRACVDLVNGH